MLHAIPGSIVLSLLLAAGPAAAQQLTGIACGCSLEKAGTQPQLVLDPALRVMKQTN